METKKYTAKTHVSLSLPMGEKVNAHVSFTPITGGGSVFYTSNEALQSALEKHPKYGRLYKLDTLYQAKKVVADPQPIVVKKEATEVHVTCLDDAKDYLSDRLGISRTKLRSAESIKKAAVANNVKFIGLEE